MARWLAVLEAFAANESWGIRDLAEAIGVPRSAVHRIVHEMARTGLLATADRPGRFVVGPGLVRLVATLAPRVDVGSLARPALDGLRDATGETAILTLYDPTRLQFRAVAASESTHPIRYIWASLEGWSELYLGASGKGILAFLPSSEQEAALARAPDPVGGPRSATKTRVHRELDIARRQGWVISRSERVAGAVGVAAPILDHLGSVVGSVLLGWPDNRTDAVKESDAARDTVRAAAHISARLASARRAG